MLRTLIAALPNVQRVKSFEDGLCRHGCGLPILSREFFQVCTGGGIASIAEVVG
mgnify:CR=1 FL=1